MKKICFMATVSFALDTFVLETAKKLLETGDFDITFICNPDESFRQRLDKRFHFIPLTMKRGYDFGFVSIIIKLVKILKREKFDIIQYSTENASLYGAIAAKIAKIPIVIYAQWGVRHRNMKKGIKRMFFFYLEKIMCKNATAIRPTSPLHAELCINEKLYNKEKAKVLGKGGTIGVDLGLYNINRKLDFKQEVRNKYGIATEALVFGFSGRITKDKGILELLAAFDRINDGQRNIKLLLVGKIDVNDGLDKSIKNRLANDKNIIITGKMDKNEMPKMYSAMDVYVHPTYREGFGMAIQEAAAMQVPTITTMIPGASEVMVDGESCLLVPMKDDKKLSEAMLYLYDNREVIITMGNAARERVENFFERSKMINRQVEDYINLSNEKEKILC